MVWWVVWSKSMTIHCSHDQFAAANSTASSLWDNSPVGYGTTRWGMRVTKLKYVYFKWIVELSWSELSHGKFHSELAIISWLWRIGYSELSLSGLKHHYYYHVPVDSGEGNCFVWLLSTWAAEKSGCTLSSVFVWWIELLQQCVLPEHSLPWCPKEPYGIRFSWSLLTVPLFLCRQAIFGPDFAFP